ncbi:MAG: hypothetical protein R3D27_09435 [Hyphomicrobiaceae bacterium]
MTRIIATRTALVLVATVGAAVALATGASAASYKSKNLDRAESRVEHRYQAGRTSGAITWREGLRVRRALAEYRALERSYKADGRLTAYERRVLANKLAAARSAVRTAAHNDYRRAPVLPRVGR